MPNFNKPNCGDEGLVDNRDFDSSSRMSVNSSVDSSSNMSVNSSTDQEYFPSTSDSDISSTDSIILENSAEDFDLNNNQFLVFGTCLNKLFSYVRCEICGNKVIPSEVYTRGTLLSVHFHCEGGHDFLWKSQPEVGRTSVGNLLMSAAILFSGTSFSKIASLSSLLNLQFLHRTTYSRIQKTYLYPVAQEAWEDHQQSFLSSLRGKPLKLAGDGRCDSPGYSAKYGTYTLMDLDTKQIVDFKIIQSTETGNSVGMEKRGLQECLASTENFGLDVKVLATDRHVQIRSYLKKEKPEINHQFDVWHLGKSVGKKVSKKAKQKGFEDLGKWTSSIVNHLWFCASTCGEDDDILVERWCSIIQHIVNQHHFPGNFVAGCDHAPLTNDEDRKTKWLKKYSPSHKALVTIVTDKRLLNDVRRLTKFCHTGQLESYHSLLLKYCPKRLHFSMNGMKARTQLAALDYSKNVGREQATIKEGAKQGEKRFSVSFPKMSKKWVSKKVYAKKNYDFLRDMMKRVVDGKMRNNLPELKGKRLPRNIAQVERPEKSVLVAAHMSRFSSNHTIC